MKHSSLTSFKVVDSIKKFFVLFGDFVLFVLFVFFFFLFSNKTTTKTKNKTHKQTLKASYVKVCCIFYLKKKGRREQFKASFKQSFSIDQCFNDCRNQVFLSFYSDDDTSCVMFQDRSQKYEKKKNFQLFQLVISKFACGFVFTSCVPFYPTKYDFYMELMFGKFGWGKFCLKHTFDRGAFCDCRQC